MGASVPRARSAPLTVASAVPSRGSSSRAGAEPVDRPVLVRDGDIERISDGWHPVVAAPGATMYYLWALADDTDTVDTRVDTRFE